MSNRIYFLSSKGAVIQRELEIDKDFKERDFAFISNMIDENFKGQIYYD